MRSERLVYLITGSTSPLGQAVAQKLASTGASVALVYHEAKEKALALASKLASARTEVKTFRANLALPGAASKLVAEVTQTFARLDGLVNNASLFLEAPHGNVTTEAWETLFALNVAAPFFLIQSAAPWLRKTHGAVVNISDLYADRPLLSNHIPYLASKGALNTITKAYARALAPEIRINAVSPGAITFPEHYSEDQREKIQAHIPLGRTGQPEDIAEAVVFLLQKGLYLTGVILGVDGGRSLT